MAALTWANVTDFQPAFAAIPPDVQAYYLNWAESVSSSAFGGVDSATHKLARLYLIGHACTLYKRSCDAYASNTSGLVSSETAGGLSVSYATGGTASLADYTSTGYGTMYLELVRSSTASRGPWVL